MSGSKAMAILAALSLGASFAEDPPARIEKAKPTLGEYPVPEKEKPPPPPVPRSPDEPRPIGVNNFRLFWINDYSGNIPVRWAVTPLEPFASADWVAVPKSAPVVGILAGDVRAKAHYPPEGSSNVIAIWGVSNGRVLLQADGVKDGQIVTLVKLTIEIGGPQSPIPPPPKPDPPVDPPKPLKGHFMTIRPNGPVSPEYVRIMSDPAWKELTAAGHAVKDYTLAEASAVVVHIPPGTTLPCVITLDAGKGTVLAGPVALPTDSAGIRKLAEGVK